MKRFASKGKSSKSQTSAEWARREEDRRRKERANDVVIGKSSAIPGEKDYPIDPSATEQEWMRQASPVEKEIFLLTERGMSLLKSLRVDAADQAFTRVFELKPDAYLWQAGIAKFYLDDMESAADIFARCADYYETRFGEPASEERIWRYASELRMKNGEFSFRKGRMGNLAYPELRPLPQRENTNELLRSEMRRVLRIAQELFEATVKEDALTVVVARAKLRTIGGSIDRKPVLDRKMWKLSAWYYLGLHHDVLGEYDESQECMKMAIRLSPSSGNAQDIVHTLPMLHMSQRDWFDDEVVEDFDDQAPQNLSSTYSADAASGRDTTDQRLLDTIKKGLFNLRHNDLKEALRARNLKIVGSKEQLVDRLLQSLRSGAEFNP